MPTTRQVEVVVEREPVAPLFEQPREPAADVAEADEGEISAHADAPAESFEQLADQRER